MRAPVVFLTPYVLNKANRREPSIIGSDNLHDITPNDLCIQMAAAAAAAKKHEAPTRVTGGTEVSLVPAPVLRPMQFEDADRLLWRELQAETKCDHARSGILYELVYRSGSERADRNLGLLSAAACLHLLHACHAPPSFLEDNLLMRHDNPDTLRILMRATASTVIPDTTDQRVLANTRYYRQYFRDVPLRLAKLFVIFAAVVNVRSFQERIRPLMHKDAWARLLPVLYNKFDAFKSGRPLGVRSRFMLSKLANNGSKHSTNASVSAIPMMDESEERDNGRNTVVRTGSKVLDRPRLPAYCGLVDAILDMCNLYD